METISADANSKGGGAVHHGEFSCECSSIWPSGSTFEGNLGRSCLTCLKRGTIYRTALSLFQWGTLGNMMQTMEDDDLNGFQVSPKKSPLWGGGPNTGPCATSAWRRRVAARLPSRLRILCFARYLHLALVHCLCVLSYTTTCFGVSNQSHADNIHFCKASTRHSVQHGGGRKSQSVQAAWPGDLNTARFLGTIDVKQVHQSSLK